MSNSISSLSTLLTSQTNSLELPLGDSIRSIFPPDIISIMLSYSEPYTIRDTAQHLRLSHNENQVIEDAFNEQIESRNGPNRPMTYLEYYTLSLETVGALPRILQLDCSDGNIMPRGLLDIIKRCHNLQVLILREDQNIDDAWLRNLETLPLKSLTISMEKMGKNAEGLQHLPKLQCLNLSGNLQAKDLTRLPSSLKHLNLSNCSSRKSMTHIDIRNLQKLKSLNLSGFCQLNPNVLWNNLIARPSLRYIDLSSCDQLSPTFVKSLINEFSTPRSIKFDEVIYTNHQIPKMDI